MKHAMYIDPFKSSNVFAQNIVQVFIFLIAGQKSPTKLFDTRRRRRRRRHHRHSRTQMLMNNSLVICFALNKSKRAERISCLYVVQPIE